jgi:hypothetical protein
MEKFKCPIVSITKSRISGRAGLHCQGFGMMPNTQARATQGSRKTMNSQERDRLYRKGLEAFNSGHFYEAHEHWEEVWLKTLNPEKMFLQGLIQVAAAFHHHSRANLEGTRNLLREGLAKLERFPEEHGELEIENLRAAVRGWLAAIAVGDTCEAKKPPRIKSHR